MFLEKLNIVKNQKILDKFEFNNSKKCCLAPYTTINFDTFGEMRFCCFNTTHILGKYPKTSIKEAWNSPVRKDLIKALTKKDFSKGCKGCYNQIVSNNSSNGIFEVFDSLDSLYNKDYPVSFTFEFGNICNYECITCGGKWSSSIRKNRENLPAIKHPYGDEFVKELEEFIPNLVNCNFLGGEPFLNPIYYKILDLIIEKKPDLDITITTNGSIYNSRIENYIKKLPNLKIVISIDSLEKKNYEFIRKNGNFENVMENLNKFKSQNRLLGIAVTPIVQNIYELPNFINFCLENEILIFINIATNPLGGSIKGIHEGETTNCYSWYGCNEKSEKINVKLEELIPKINIKELKKDKLEEIISYLEKFDFPKFGLNYKYKDFINYLKNGF